MVIFVSLMIGYVLRKMKKKISDFYFLRYDQFEMSHLKSIISQKLKIRKLYFFRFSIFSIHNPSFRIIKSPLRIIKSKRLFLRGWGGGPQIVNWERALIPNIATISSYSISFSIFLAVIHYVMA